MTYVGSVYCTSDINNPTPVYVVEGGEAVLQCGFTSMLLQWYDYKAIGGTWDIVADGGTTIDGSKYSTSKNTPTALYYRLHILNVGESDLKKYRCEGGVNGVLQYFYLQLIFIGRCNYILVIFNVVKQVQKSCRLTWKVYNGGSVNIIASGSDINAKSKYNVSTNPSTGLYYRLHILNVGMSDVKKYRCNALVNGVKQEFFLKLDLLGRCYIMVIFNVLKQRFY